MLVERSQLELQGCKTARAQNSSSGFAILHTHSDSLDLVANAQAWHSQLEGKHDFESLQGK